MYHSTSQTGLVGQTLHNDVVATSGVVWRRAFTHESLKGFMRYGVCHSVTSHIFISKITIKSL